MWGGGGGGEGARVKWAYWQSLCGSSLCIIIILKMALFLEFDRYEDGLGLAFPPLRPTPSRPALHADFARLVRQFEPAGQAPLLLSDSDSKTLAGCFVQPLPLGLSALVRFSV
jgi:hypothetical protein